MKNPKRRAFDNDIRYFESMHYQALAEAKLLIRKWQLERKLIQVDTYFCFPQIKILTKDSGFKEPKRLDSDNRLKPINDALSYMLDIDDCHFWAGYREKVVHPDGKEFVSVKIHPIEINHETRFKELFSI